MNNKGKLINNIRNLSQTYKRSIDVSASGYRTEKTELENFLKSKKGQWTPEYIAEYRKNWTPKTNYKAETGTMRKIAKASIQENFRQLHNAVDEFFKEEPRSSFTNRILANKMLGIELSANEKKLLKADIQNYNELRLYSALVGEDCEIDIESMNNSLNYSERALLSSIDVYHGENADLYDLCNNNPVISKTQSIASGNTLTNDILDRLESSFESINVFDSIVKPLSKNERSLIDCLMGVYADTPSLYQSHISELCNKDNDLIDLFSRDERYSAYVPESVVSNTSET